MSKRGYNYILTNKKDRTLSIGASSELAKTFMNIKKVM